MIGIAAALILSACAASRPVEVALTSEAPTVTATRPPATSTPTLRATASRIPARSSTPDYTATPEGTPTATPPFRALPDGRVVTYAAPLRTPSTPIPPAAEFIPAPNGVTTVLLIGSDKRAGGGGNATDTIILVAVHRESNSVNMLSIPRDTYVYIPGWNMDRINTAMVRGEITGYPGGGVALLSETILYNFGVAVDYYARVDFSGFEQVINMVGGIDVAVDCAVTDWRLISPELDINDPDNWELITLGVGMRHLDGALALWYARSRLNTSDFDRNRRQQQILRALAQKVRGLDLIPHLPTLWGQVNEVVETDMEFVDALELAPIALKIDSSRVRGRNVAEALSGWREPYTGAAVQLPDLELLPGIVSWLYVEPGNYAVALEGSSIEVLNGTNNHDWDVVAVERLAWDGLSAVAAGQDVSLNQQRTRIIDYTGRVRGTTADVLADVLKVPEEDILVQPDPSREVDFKVILGYNFDTCTYR